jgi:hypothetical protein
MEPASPPNPVRRRRSARFVVIAGTLVAAVGLWGLAQYPRWANRRATEARQRTALYATDHAALLDACRAVWRARQQQVKDGGGHACVEPADPALPPVVRSLGAHAIDAWPSGVTIELGGQWCHFGFEAFFATPATDPTRAAWKDVFPAERLAEGFWYYCEAGVVRP